MVGLTALVHKAHVYETLLKLMTAVDSYVKCVTCMLPCDGLHLLAVANVHGLFFLLLSFLCQETCSWHRSHDLFILQRSQGNH